MIRDYLRRAYRTALPLLYARKNFKLFLKTSLLDIDARLRHMALATDVFSSVLQPVPIRAPFGKSMLVLAPHQDDEVIGCGGALALQVQAKGGAFVVLLQDGADEHDAAGMTRQELVLLRNDESRRAAARLGIEPPRILGHADLAANARAATEEVRTVIVDRKADAVFVPFILDGHPDHRTANYILADALREVDFSVRVFAYEVWGLCIANVILAIDAVMERKMEMLACFEFANQALDYAHATKGLNMYRSRMLSAGAGKYAECFFEMPRQEYVALVDRLRAAEPRTGG
jgi:LmbE family N-acetylglucosaminyl deacetylase